MGQPFKVESKSITKGRIKYFIRKRGYTLSEVDRLCRLNEERTGNILCDKSGQEQDKAL